MNPKYPIYIVSKNRWENGTTYKAFERMGVPYYIVVEKDQYEKYCSVIDKSKVLILPEKYLNEYDTFDKLGRTKSTGPGAARNFCWDHSMKNGFAWHWVFDDNVSGFCRLNNNRKIPVADGTIFKVMEDFCERYENIAIAGPNYRFFVPDRNVVPPYILNWRVYSMLLIRNDIPYRWRGRYNEDTDLSIRAMKDGWCTIQFNAFLGDKIGTQKMSGGNSEDFYFKEGTEAKSKMLVAMHPDITKLIEYCGRCHHKVDYSQFKKNKLKRKPGIVIEDGINNYGMKLIKV
jgi:hypothetical protein